MRVQQSSSDRSPDAWIGEIVPGELKRGEITGAGTIGIGGDLRVCRLGYGALRITGQIAWGDPPDRAVAKAVLRRALDLGVNFIDTAESYGPGVSEELIHEALFPYPDELVIATYTATKGGMNRFGPDSWGPDGRPERLRHDCEASLARLGLERLPVYQLHQPDPRIHFLESVGALVELQKEGKIRHIGLSNVTAQQLRAAQDLVEIVSVQNRYNLDDRSSEELVDLCEKEGIVFMPFRPLSGASDHSSAIAIARAHRATPPQIALAYLLARSSAMLPIPGTGSRAHLEENVSAGEIQLTESEVADLRGS